jgi:hypothetical protein
MRRKPFPIADLMKGLEKQSDGIFITDGASPDSNLVRIYQNVIKKDFIFTAFEDDAPDSEYPLAFGVYKKWDGTEQTYMVTVDDFHYLSSGTWTQARVAPGSSPSFTGDEDDYVSVCTADNTLVITNGVDTILEWDGSTMTALGGLTNIVAKFAVPFYDTLVFANITDTGTANPIRVMWSEIGDIEDYSSGNAGNLDLTDDPEPITFMGLLGDRLFVFKQNSIWEIFLVNEATVGGNLFDKRLVNGTKGTSAPGSVVSLGDRLIFLGNDDIYSFDGEQLQPIMAQVTPWIFNPEESIVDWSKINRVPALYDEASREYVIALPTVTDANPNLVLRYNLKHGFVTKREKQVSVISRYTVQQDRLTWTEAKALGTKWNDASWARPWKSFALPSEMPSVIFGAPDGTFEELDRGEIDTGEFKWVSKDFIFGQSQRVVWFELRVKSTGFYFSYSVDGGGNWSPAILYSPETDSRYVRVRCEVGVTCDMIRMRITTTNNIEFVLPTPWYIPRVRWNE